MSANVHTHFALDSDEQPECNTFNLVLRNLAEIALRQSHTAAI